jgi:UDP-N-acetyl-D-glucosamine/UDP-N-acetyl-D-galactosamine dehydrogenase
MNLDEIEITVVGLGYVGLPLAVEFGKNIKTIGYDINPQRIEELKKGVDRTKELDENQIKSAKYLTFKSILNAEQIRIKSHPSPTLTCIYIITVPTPIDDSKKPDLRPLLSASKTVGMLLKKRDIVIYESTVYPGCTEEDCVPILENESGLKYNQDFFCGYSPERINPGDKEKTVTKIIKVTSGSTPQVADFIDQLYRTIIEAGTYKAPSIKVAEAAKLLENCQRDVNIAFINEAAMIFDKLGIDTTQVLETAGTKWNFLKFKQGLVGGHCTGIDPYYMIHKAEQNDYSPKIISAAREINEQIGVFVATKIIKLMIQKGIKIKNAKALILGFTFKENCSDIKNTKVIDVYNELTQFGINVNIYDPLADKVDVEKKYQINLIEKLDKKYDLVIMAVAHEIFQNIDYSTIKKPKSIIFDIKSVLPINQTDDRF